MSLPISLANVTPLDMSKLKLVQAPPEEVARMREIQAKMYAKPVIPQQTNYAEVKVNGRTVATISNGGGVTSSNAMGPKIQNILVNEGNSRGPQLAAQRAQRIAEALGGTVEVASTAQTQSEWEARPPVTWRIDEAMLEQRGFTIPPGLGSERFSSATLAADTIAALLFPPEQAGA